MTDAVYCFRCNYDLRGAADDQPCPECGLLSGRSRRATDALREARPKWLRSLSVGVWMILLAIGLTFIAAPLGQSLETWVRGQMPSLTWSFGPSIPPATVRAWRTYRRIEPLLLWAGWLVAAALLFCGIFLLTRGEGYEPADRSDRRRRMLLRIFANVPVLAVVMVIALEEHFEMLNFSYLYQGQWRWAVVIAALLTIGCVPLPALGFRQLRSLACRAGSRHLAEHCAIVGLGASLSLLAIFAAFLLTVFPHELGLPATWQSNSLASLIILLVVYTAATLFWLWSLYLMIRFAFSFARASREVRRLWRAADRAVG